MRPKSLLALLAAVLGALLALSLSGRGVASGTAPSGAVPLATNTPYYRIDEEPGGDIDAGTRAQWDGVYENTSGAMVWNGTEWIINGTRAHTYYAFKDTGARLMAHTVAASYDGTGAPSTTYVPVSFGGPYTVTQSLYVYTVPARAGGTYTYQGIQYRITQPDSKRLILRSRGCGLGTGQAYLDVYIEDPYAGVHVSALRGDPIMYVYSTTIEQALLITDESQGAFASLPTSAPAARARYWLDVNNGADMCGYGYTLRTQAMACRTRNLGSSLAVEFQIQFYESMDNTVHEIRFVPKLLSETFHGHVYLPMAKR